MDSRDSAPPATRQGDDEATLVDGQSGGPSLDPTIDEFERRLGLGQPVQLGRYVLLRKLGEGGMSLVFVAYDERLDRRVALKLLRRARQQSQSDRLRIQREAKAMARLSHPNVVQVYDVGEWEGRLFLTMELVSGGTLRHVLRQQPRPWSQVIPMFEQVGAGLLAAHRHGLIHRDLKPDNVLVDEEERVRVVDFGLARAGGQAQHTWHEESSDHLDAPLVASNDGLGEPLTVVGQVVGTPAYMPLEQMKGEDVDERTDQFSFCVMLFEALHGVRPFAGNTMRELARNAAVGRMVTPTPREGLPAVPGWLQEIVIRGLSPRPDDRWPDMQTLLEALTRDPARDRRRWWWLGGGALSLGGVALTVALGDPARPCTGFEGNLRQVWDEPTKAEVEAAVLATGASFARDAWARMEPQLTAYAADWAEARAAVCRSHQRKEVSHAEHDRQVACLERHHGRLEALVTNLRQADTAVVERAVRAATGLPVVDECRDLAKAQDRAPRPDDETTAREVEQLQRQLVAAVTTTNLGRHDQGRAQARTVVERAREVGYAPFLAEALLAAGKIEDRDGQYEAALALTDEAVWLARTAGHDSVEGDAASSMMLVTGSRLARFDEAEVWRRHASAILARRPDDARLHARAQMQMGSLALERGKLDEALEHYERSLALEEQQHGADSYAVSAVLENMAAVLERQGRYEQALEVSRRSLALREDHLGPEHPEIAMALHGQAIILENKGDYDEAIALFRRALTSSERALGPDHMRVAYPRFGLANVLHYTGHHEEALGHFQKSLRSLSASVGPEHPHVATAHNNIGLVLHALERHEEALAAFDRARELAAARLGPQHADVARGWSNRGMVLLDAGDTAAAGRAYRKALEIYAESLPPEHPSLGYPLTGLAQVEVVEGRYADAVSLAQRAIDIRTDVAAAERALSRKVLAEALWVGDLGRSRAVEVAREAAQILQGVEGSEDLLAEIEQWLREHPTPLVSG